MQLTKMVVLQGRSTGIDPSNVRVGEAEYASNHENILILLDADEESQLRILAARDKPKYVNKSLRN
jgi:hypothetical protein